ncbi:hypothetical protein DOS70_11310 [Staphylococcus felis]|uniref:Uncharacterized protein n=1 Tax=Staphylococcus felis TaxID=46127 RepID=A0A2K3Z8U6_9STAP|nr:hypothetical protein C7J90_09245 [Staphylococcus felis]PNZ34282.1 hypothetical protein CD143_09805 [Staphylococcus felis]REH78599.1 hypothetical protein DOS60_03410 [Staphylococcus felis]REH80486.1 hypothetical protein DOS59_01405 [Staphylococcus felis]REH82428.1 hypothetical protein DOS63_09905 [Staphylococcus felis]
MIKKYYSKSGFTLPLLFIIFSTYTFFMSFYLVIYTMKIQSLDALIDYYNHEIQLIMQKGDSNEEK